MRRTIFSAALLLVLAGSDMAMAQVRGGIRIGGGPAWGGYGTGYGGRVRIGGVSATYSNWRPPYGYGYNRGGYYVGNRYYNPPRNFYYTQPNYVLGPTVIAPVAAPVMMTVFVPKGDAEVFVNGTTTTMKGTERWFESRPLHPGVNYTYTLKAKWMEKGKTVEQTRELHVVAGEKYEIDFRKSAD